MKNKSRIVLVGILALLSVITVPSALAAQGDFYLDPQHSTGSAGSDTYVLVKIDTTADMKGYGTDIYFDPAIVNITNVDFSDSPWGGGMASWTWYSDHINFAEIGGTKSASTYTLANLTLRGMDAGTSDIDFSDAKLSDPSGDPLTTSTENGTYTITIPVQGDFYLDPQHSTGSVGSDTYVLLKIDTTADMKGYGTDIYFDPAIVNITNVDFSDSPWGGGTASWTWYSDHINFAEMGATKSASTYTLANMTLRGMDAGTSDIDFSDAKLSDPSGDPLTTSTENGTYTAVVGGIHDINVSTDYSSPTGIRIKEVGGADIPHGANLTIGTEYGVMTEVKNEGDFDETAVYETIKIINETGAIVFEEPTSEKTINVSESKDFEKTWNISGLTPGFYTVFVNASIVGSVDDKPENNNRTREVRLEMSGVYGVELTVDKTEETTTTNVNATYTLTVNNTGTDEDTFELIVENADDAAVANLSENQVTLASGETRTVLLNVTDVTANGYRVNVTARSQGNTSISDYVNTTTTVMVYGVELTVDKPAETTTPNVNATYTLTVNNTGTVEDTFHMTVDNADGAAVANLSKYQVPLASGTTATVLLNVTDDSANVYRVNVTARSQGDISVFDYVNTTTSVVVGPPVNIADFWIENTPATWGQSFEARLNLTTTTVATEGWYVIVVSGNELGGEYIAGIGTVYLTPGSVVNNLPVLVHIPIGTEIGDYALSPSVHTLSEYPGGLITYKGPRTATVQ